MRKTVNVDHLLENAVAAALGLDQPHAPISVGPRWARTRPVRRHAATAPRHERARAAA